MRKKTVASWNRRLTLLLGLGILLAANVVGNFFFFRIDLTEEKRFTLAPATVKLLEEIDGPVYAEVLLGGEFPAGFKRLQRSVKELLDDFRSKAPSLDYTFSDPNSGSKEQIESLRKQLADQGVFPTNLRIKESGETVEKLIYPHVILTYAGRSVAVNLLESEMPGVPPEVVLNNSVGLLEYKLASAIHRLIRKEKPNIVFLKGHGELSPEQTADLRREIRPYYNFSFLDLDSVFRINPAVDLLIVAKPRGAFSEPDKFKIDQFVMRGGKVAWFIDPLGVSLDSMRGRPGFMPLEYDLNLDDLLFKYGVRIQKNLVLDMECSGIPLQVGMVGGNPQFDLFPWFYHPVVAGTATHPVVKNLNRVQFEFPATIDTIKTKTAVRKTVLLESSQYTRMQYPPVQLSFDILRYDPDPTKFDKGRQPLAVLLEGTFASNYENRVPQAFLDSMSALGEAYRAVSEPGSMIVVADGDVLRNPYNPMTQEARPMGYNVFDRRQYANKEFVLNMIEYLIDGKGLIEARSREVRLRLLDKVRIGKEKLTWQLLNLLAPLALLVLTGFIFHLWRRRRYATVK